MRSFRPTSTKPLGTSLRTWARARDGGVAVTVAVCSAVLVGVLAIAIDLGRAYNLSTELDNAADAYALAGATQLDLTPGACLRAIRAASAAGSASALVNTETFASNPSGSDVYVDPTLSHVSNSNIRFLTDLEKDANGDLINYITDPNPAVCDETAGFIEVTIDQASENDPYRIDYSFAGIVGAATEAFPKGYAVAGSYQLFCGIAPIMVCELEDNFWDNMTGPSGDPWYYRGVGVWAKAGKPNETWGPGNAGFLDLGGTADAGGVGPPDGNGLCNHLGAVEPNLGCFSLTGLETEPGNSTGARNCFNTRFDIYHGTLDAYRSDPQFQPAANTVKGRFKNGCNDPGWQQPGTQYTGPGSIDVLNVPGDAGMPLPLDNCAYGGSCMPVGSQGRMGDGNWDLETYLAVNHPDLDPVTVTNDLMLNQTGSTGPGLGRLTDDITRYDVYKWELGFAAGYGFGDYGQIGSQNLVNTAMVSETPLPMPLGGGATPSDPQDGEYGGPQCYTGDMGTYTNGSGETKEVPLDRRVISVAVVDCTSGKNPPIRGRTTGIEAEGFMDVFLLAPWKDDGTNHEIYMEIIGPSGGARKRDPGEIFVQLYE